VSFGLDAGTVAASHERRSLPALRRFTARVPGPVVWVAMWGLAIAAELAVLLPALAGDDGAPAYRDVYRVLGGSFLACGLIAWHRRPDSRSGMLMVATGGCLLIEPLSARFDSLTVLNVGEMLEDVWGIPFVWLLLTTLTGGRLASAADRLLVAAFGLQLAIELVWHLFLEQPGNFLLAFPDADVARVLEEGNLWLVTVNCLAAAIVIGRRWRAASPPRRRAMLPAVAGIACLLMFSAVQQIQELWLIWLAVCSLLLVPAAFLAGLLRSRLARGGLADLFFDLGAMNGATLQARLARAVGDPGLVVAYPSADHGHVDGDGAPVAVPGAEAGRAVARIERDGREVAAIAYDASLDDDPELIEAVRAAAAIGLENASLRAEAEVRLAELRASRQRLVAAGDAERRRLERDLHDGAQQRLVTLGIVLRRLQRSLPSGAKVLAPAFDAAVDEVAGTIADLRTIAAGVRPPRLDEGLAAALEDLARGSAVPVEVETSGDRAPPDVEAVAYFIACEALTNAVKHASPSRVSVHAARTDGVLRLVVSDDGVGGAAPGHGSGLAGLADRVAAQGGTLVLESPAGAGTRIAVELPCAS
jgi:signal transduction histidine kinase